MQESASVRDAARVFVCYQMRAAAACAGVACWPDSREAEPAGGGRGGCGSERCSVRRARLTSRWWLQGRSAINALILPASRHYSFDHTMFRHALLLVSKKRLALALVYHFYNTPLLLFGFSLFIWALQIRNFKAYGFSFRARLLFIHFSELDRVFSQRALYLFFPEVSFNFVFYHPPCAHYFRLV